MAKARKVGGTDPLPRTQISGVTRVLAQRLRREASGPNPRIPPLRFLRTFAFLSRLIIFDRRGCGMSVPVSMNRPPDLETRMDDARAVMDNVGSERAVVYGASESGALACLFAAMHPDRTVALVVHGSNARNAWAPDYPWGLKREDLDAFVASIERAWGTEAFVREHFSDLAGDDAIIRWIATLSRYSMSPGAAAAYERTVYEDDVREILPAIHVPTLIRARARSTTATSPSASPRPSTYRRPARSTFPI